MNNKRPLLSICIPTYNRATVLEKALRNYVDDKDFDNDVEIVISDNASTDSTPLVCQSFASKYDNIKYYRNEENVRDLNFPRVLEKANGEYLKLMNDNNQIILDIGLGYLKKILKSEILLRRPLFFTNGNIFNGSNDSVVVCDSVSGFYLRLSYFVTALHVFGTWRELWEEVENKEFYSSMQLAQVDWAYQLVEKKASAVLYNNKYFDGLDVGKRSGYNYFKVLVDNYYKIILPYLNLSKVPESIRKQERATYLNRQIKKRLIWKVTSFLIPTNQNFDYSGCIGILWKYYKKDLYFYFFIIKFPFSVIKYVLLAIARKLKKLL